MKRNMLAKKLMAGVLTSTMVMSMSITAFATEDSNMKPLDPVAISAVPIEKNLLTDGKTYAPNTQFTFNVVSGDAGIYERDGNEYPVTPGPVSAVVVNDPDAFSSSDTISAEYNRVGALSFNVNEFEAPGIYSYKLTENNTGYEGVGYSDEEYVIYVFVETDGENKYVSAVTATKDGSTDVIDPTAGAETDGKAASIEFTNNYGNEDRPDDYIYDLIVTKEVTGNQGNKNESFSINVTITDEDNTDEVYQAIVYTDETEETMIGTPVQLKSGERHEFPLKHGQTVHIYGLSENDIYAVDEADYSTDGYTTTYTVSEGNTNATILDSADVKQESVSGVATGDGVKVTVENNKNVTTPTGIAMTFAPYAVMVVFAGVFAVMFLRKKREDF